VRTEALDRLVVEVGKLLRAELPESIDFVLVLADHATRQVAVGTSLDACETTELLANATKGCKAVQS
jgi:hypothetical protein